MTRNESYRHTQWGKWHRFLYMVPLLLFTLASVTWNEAWAVNWILLGAGTLVLILTLSFHRLTIYDDGDSLAIRYGPLPLLGKRIPYKQITGVRQGKTSPVDGWGMNYVPGRGWTLNLWGWDCVELSLGRRIVRVGTDDPGKLTEFLQARTGTARIDNVRNGTGREAA